MWKSRAQVAENCLKVRRVDCVTNAPVPQGTTALSTPPFVRAGYGCRNNTTVLSRPEAAGWAPLVCAGPLTTSLRGLWVSGLLPPGNGGTNEGAATQKPTVRHKGAATQKPTNERRNSRSNLGARERDPRTLASWRHCFLQVVAATASATITSSKPTPSGMGCLWSASGTGLLGSGTGLFLPVLIVCVFAGTGTCFPGVRLLGLPVLSNHPWPLRRSRGDGNGRPCCHPFYGTACAFGLTWRPLTGSLFLSSFWCCLKPGPSG